MNKKRLLNVAKALRESPNPAEFTMHHVHDCGTPACALGHYAARRDLQQIFQLPTELAREFNRDLPVTAQRYLGKNCLLVGVWGATKPADGWIATVAHHFAISPLQVDELFNAKGCGYAKSPEAAAKYIERFVAARG